MDYIVGSVAALVSGNVTPNRPKLIRRAFTPTKHQPSPNITPKSEYLEDRSIFLSPTMQKKKAIIKKSPKRIFQSSDISDNENILASPQANKVKKHLKDELESREKNDLVHIPKSPKKCTPKSNKTKVSISEVLLPPVNSEKENNSEMELNDDHSKFAKRKNKKLSESNDHELSETKDPDKHSTKIAKKKGSQNLSKAQKRRLRKQETIKKIRGLINLNDDPSGATEEIINTVSDLKIVASSDLNTVTKNKKNDKKNNKKSNVATDNLIQDTRFDNLEATIFKEDIKNKSNNNKKRKHSEKLEPTVSSDINNSDIKSQKKDKKKKSNTVTDNLIQESTLDNLKTTISKEDIKNTMKINKKRKHSEKLAPIDSSEMNNYDIESPDIEKEVITPKSSPIKNKKNKKSKQKDIQSEKNNNKNKLTIVNPNAITNKDTDSEHDSDNEIESENEEEMKEVLDTFPEDVSSGAEDDKVDDEVKKPEKTEKDEKPFDVNELKRTLFVGNVPFSSKCKKEIKKIFIKYGAIETVRIRTIPVKDARVTPKLAVIKNELHPDRTTVNVYVRFADVESVDKALAENNTVLSNCHLRVTKSETTGAEYDPKLAVYVGNVPFACEDETLREKFTKCGEIISIRIIRDKKTNVGKGFAYVNFASKDGVELALGLSEEDLTIKNRILRVQRCLQGKKKHQGQAQSQRSQGQQRFQVPFRSQSHSRSQGEAQRGQSGDRGYKRPGQSQDRNFRPGQNQNNRGGFRKPGQFQNRTGNDNAPTGAHRRVMNKRKNEENIEGPPNKRQQLNQPNKEKKARKEFVGMTAEKKKKNTFTKGQKKKKILGEIMTKHFK